MARLFYRHKVYINKFLINYTDIFFGFNPKEGLAGILIMRMLR
jgi:hypothetical protein